MSLPPNILNRIIQENNERDDLILGKFAYPNKLAKRKHEESLDYRSIFTRDADRIIHSLSFARYFDKTQAFFWVNSDIHQRRMLHVQLVAKIARELAIVLNLNQDLVEAIALGHDIGHVPFGHDGEKILSRLCNKHGIGGYYHNLGSIHFLQEIEMQNLTLPVVDGILCHNGEKHHRMLYPSHIELTWENHEREIQKLLDSSEKNIYPKTLEGSLVRVVDTISYISRDILDAEHMGLLKFSDIPQSVQKILGNTNRGIINCLISDLIKNSIDCNYIAYSEDVFSALTELYSFNLNRIYLHEDKLQPLKIIEKAFGILWDKYYNDLTQKKTQSKIFVDHLELNLNQIKTRLPNINSLEKYPYARQMPEIIVRDFLAGMTDQYFWELAREIDPSLVFHPETVY
ncbi:deoxyguanosinetriphosphate triphosphohydrolase family protein [Promethearchaeum syntrophicum]|uniref:Deoxyguanosinetriphosphate triphosphohydrolase family protein n=1 Tax=Promethearchaeum syntrophicum TaxID=2594042 RepID=A0A5B9DDZ2_9ARCH|nr:HD domain-containing protein [Candidatus Prometheoarchaeum syntrophicum]QEE17010.1 deoxyguanosinetriphosphate triphosphohydrolase-like protein [Candidatus Prometheoarchaeum syntrophicum]